MAKKFQMDWGKITQKVKEAESKGGFEKDERIYIPKVSDKGNAKVLMRFLPQKSDINDVPYVKVFTHGFKFGSSWFFNNCPTTIGKPCPVCEDNTENWDLDKGTEREPMRRDRSRKLNVYANVLILDDKQQPENNGKVFIYRFGKTIFDKIMKKYSPSDEDIDLGEEPVNVFDYYSGLNFKLEIKTKKTGNKSFLNYDDSAFSEIETPIADGNDDEIEKINAMSYDINDLVAPEKFLSYEELSKRLNKVLGKNKTEFRSQPEESDDESYEESSDDVNDEPDNRDSFLEKLRKNTSN
jgi:hypothetical protein